MVDPRAFAATDEPGGERCAVCGGHPTHYRERRSPGTTASCRQQASRADLVVEPEQARLTPVPEPMDAASPGWTPRRLCTRCFDAAVVRERAKGGPLAGTVDLSSLEPVTASVGRCTVCVLEPAAWAGTGVQLCEACYEREVRRCIEAGATVPAKT